MKLYFDKFKCPSCNFDRFKVCHEPTEWSVNRGYADPNGYADFFYGRCLSCGYNLNLSMAILEEFGEDHSDGRRSGPYPCLALERGYVEPDPKDANKTVIRYAYECSQSQRRKKTEEILKEAANKSCTVRNQEGGNDD